MEFYLENKWHELDGVKYFVPLTYVDLKECEDKEHCVTTFIRSMRDLFRGDTSFNQPIGAWDTSSVKDM